MPRGPMRPPSDDPKSNVLFYALMGCTVAAFILVVMAPGLWRFLAAIPIALGIWIFIKIIRRAREVNPTWGGQ